MWEMGRPDAHQDQKEKKHQGVDFQTSLMPAAVPFCSQRIIRGISNVIKSQGP